VAPIPNPVSRACARVFRDRDGLLRTGVGANTPRDSDLIDPTDLRDPSDPRDPRDRYEKISFAPATTRTTPSTRRKVGVPMRRLPSSAPISPPTITAPAQIGSWAGT
jgi:hypothetical protein